MKNVVLMLSLQIAFLTTYAQNPSSSKIGLYRWKEAVMIQPCDVTGTPLTSKQEIPSKAGQRFRVLRTTTNLAIIQILDYTKSTGKRVKNSTTKKIEPLPDFFTYNYTGNMTDYKGLPDDYVNARNYMDKQAYFSVPISIIDDENCVIKENRIAGALAAGVINFPFKYRPQKNNTDFSGAFNFGAGIGYKFSHKSWREFTYSVISGYSISNVVLDSSNANKNQGQLSSTNNFTAFSFSLGILAEYQRVQAGIFIGWDKIGKLNQRQYEWQYQGKPWISVGFGFAIFAGQKEQIDKNVAVAQ